MIRRAASIHFVCVETYFLQCKFALQNNLRSVLKHDFIIQDIKDSSASATLSLEGLPQATGA